MSVILYIVGAIIACIFLGIAVVIPPLAWGIVLVVGGVWLVTAGLCKASANGDRHRAIHDELAARRSVRSVPGEEWTDEDRTHFEKHDDNDRGGHA
jgi:hypothetical protein